LLHKRRLPERIKKVDGVFKLQLTGSGKGAKGRETKRREKGGAGDVVLKWPAPRPGKKKKPSEGLGDFDKKRRGWVVPPASHTWITVLKSRDCSCKKGSKRGQKKKKKRDRKALSKVTTRKKRGLFVVPAAAGSESNQTEDITGRKGSKRTG